MSAVGFREPPQRGVSLELDQLAEVEGGGVDKGRQGVGTSTRGWWWLVEEKDDMTSIRKMAHKLRK
jgi:hypothetical protein